MERKLIIAIDPKTGAVGIKEKVRGGLLSRMIGIVVGIATIAIGAVLVTGDSTFMEMLGAAIFLILIGASMVFGGLRWKIE